MSRGRRRRSSDGGLRRTWSLERAPGLGRCCSVVKAHRGPCSTTAEDGEAVHAGSGRTAAAGELDIGGSQACRKADSASSPLSLRLALRLEEVGARLGLEGLFVGIGILESNAGEGSRGGVVTSLLRREGAAAKSKVSSSICMTITIGNTW